jgi:hypothetical protein
VWAKEMFLKKNIDGFVFSDVENIIGVQTSTSFSIYESEGAFSGPVQKNYMDQHNQIKIYPDENLIYHKNDPKIHRTLDWIILIYIRLRVLNCFVKYIKKVDF